MIDGNLVIRSHDRGAFDVSLVPTGRPAPAPLPVRRLRDAAALRQLLFGIGFDPSRVEQLLESPYVLQSIPVRVHQRAAARTGLVPPGPVRHLLGRLAQIVREPARLVRLVADRTNRSRPRD